MIETKLKTILQYSNENVISRFLDMFEMPETEAQDIFKETKKFLYLTDKGEDVFICDDMLIIDEMWHNFVLFTNDYYRFCHQYFNTFKHHIPATKQEKHQYKRKLQEQPEETKQKMLSRIEQLISLTYDHLGEATVIKWFSVYPEKYHKAYIKSIRRS